MSELTDKLKQALWTNGLGDYPNLNQDIAEKLIALAEAADLWQTKEVEFPVDCRDMEVLHALAELEKELE